MFKAEKKQFKKICLFFAKLPRILSEKAFLTSLIFLFIATILGGLVFYKYNILVRQKEPESSQALLYFDEKNLQELIKTWQERQNKFNEAGSRQYLNPFKAAP